MTLIRLSLSALMATLLLLVPLPASADDMTPLAGLRWGAHVRPLDLPRGSDLAAIQGGVVAPKSPHQSIRMGSEEVIIRLKSYSYVVQAVFNFFNEGETTTEWTGIPKWVASRIPSFPTFIRFKGSVNGKEIVFNGEWDISGGARVISKLESVRRKLSKEPMKHKRQWLVSQVTFPGHANTTIRVTYEAPYSRGGLRASYIYGTGALWKDKIGKAVFVVDSTAVGGKTQVVTNFDEDLGYMKRVVRRPISNSVVKYELSDFEPCPEAVFRLVLLGPPPPLRARIKR